MTDAALIEDVRRRAGADGTVEDRARQTAELIRARTGRRWVGIYRVTRSEVRNLAWSGPSPPAYPNFAVDQGLTGAALRTGRTIVSNDVASDDRYLTNQESTGSELIVPVVIDRTAVGTLDIEDARIDAFDEADQTLFESIAAALTDLYC